MEHVIAERWCSNEMSNVKTEYRSQNDKGDAHRILYQVFSGIEIIYNFAHTDHYCPGGSNISKAQADLAKEAAAYLACHMDEHVTVSELSARFYVSQTHMQNTFKGVYGVPVQSCIRILKMQSAALMLIHTDLPVLEIASRCGYDNSSKFAHAFHKIMGKTPMEYRKMHGEQ